MRLRRESFADNLKSGEEVAFAERDVHMVSFLRRKRAEGRAVLSMVTCIK